MEIEKLVSRPVAQAEDKAFKTAAQYFAEELLPYFHVEGKVIRVFPTEVVHLEARQLTQDFNFLMEKGYIAHFEFQSASLTEDDLRRFREYEATTSRIYKMKVVTYVVFSGKVKHLMTSLDVGLKEYEIVPIILRDDNADEWIHKIKKIMNQGVLPGEKDLVPLMLTPLMSGKSTQMERFTFGFDVLRQVEKKTGSNTKSEKMQAILYTLANKFLNTEELNQVKEMISMTVLGEMLFNDGIQKGLERGRKEERERGVSAFIHNCKDFNATRDVTKGKIRREFELTEKAAEQYLKKYWK